EARAAEPSAVAHAAAGRAARAAGLSLSEHGRSRQGDDPRHARVPTSAFLRHARWATLSLQRRRSRAATVAGGRGAIGPRGSSPLPSRRDRHLEAGDVDLLAAEAPPPLV